MNNFVGDAIVVVFGAPLDQPESENCAVAAALAMRDRLRSLNQRRVARGEEPLRAGVGIGTGEAVAGQIGSKERLQYTVIGDVVNVASRLEGLTKELPEYDILVNESTALPLLLRDDLSIKSLGLIKVRGRNEPVNVYAVIGWDRAGKKDPALT